ncbi:hypothetical protein AB0I49_08355 [Streptomyces sp. NPDC050617]|uniref:hypothetical protein n=1 Tax=Streptomyces sp. NPDC050617 TaxID=3154628 RepID=UPI0034255FCE
MSGTEEAKIMMDPGNPVVRLCVQGMEAETRGAGADADARRLFVRAWETAADDYEACVAAHYVARHQPTARATLNWNAECLRRAELVGDERVRGFFPSLHLNMARAHQELGDRVSAREHFRRAAGALADAPPGPYGDWGRYAVAEGLRGTGGVDGRADEYDGRLRELVTGLCARADLVSLALVLPAFVGDLGTDGDRVRLLTALGLLHAGRRLPAAEQASLGEIIASLRARADPDAL